MALGDFAPQAKAYAARPGYPDALVGLVAQRAGVAAGDRVADIGAGTGKLTQHLADRRRHVARRHVRGDQPACRRCITCIWNDRRDEHSPMLRAVMNVIRREAPEFDERYRDHDWTVTLGVNGWFTDIVTDEVEHVVTMSRDRFRALWRSHDHLAETAGARLPRVLAGIDAITATVDEIAVPYRTRAFTARALHR